MPQNPADDIWKWWGDQFLKSHYLSSKVHFGHWQQRCFPFLFHLVLLQWLSFWDGIHVTLQLVFHLPQSLPFKTCSQCCSCTYHVDVYQSFHPWGQSPDIWNCGNTAAWRWMQANIPIYLEIKYATTIKGTSSTPAASYLMTSVPLPHALPAPVFKTCGTGGSCGSVWTDMMVTFWRNWTGSGLIWDNLSCACPFDWLGCTGTSGAEGSGLCFCKAAVCQLSA